MRRVWLIAGALAALALPAPAAPLTAAEKKAGWTLLFDGRTTAGWRGFKTPEPDAGWTVKDGILTPDPKTSKDLVSKASFENFELSWEWRIAPKGNSGIMFHVLDEGDETYWSGPEYQLLDNARGEPPLEQAGGLFALYAPVGAVPKPVGEFNRSRLVVDHGRVQHWLNDVKVAEYNMASADFRARVAASKFRRWPIFATGKAGHIALQNHGDAVAFRDIRIRVIR